MGVCMMPKFSNSATTEETDSVVKANEIPAGGTQPFAI